MNGSKTFPEPERYEFRESQIHHFHPDRRDFFKLLGAGIMVFSVASDALAIQESGGTRRTREDEPPKDITAWLHIGEDGSVTVFTKGGDGSEYPHIPRAECRGRIAWAIRERALGAG
jgi:hypothetical protein